jgi:rubredoxin
MIAPSPAVYPGHCQNIKYIKELGAMARYQCPDCSYVYDEVKGEAHEGFPPHTPWAQIPEDWACPDCAVREKPDFIPLGLAVARRKR